jgi:hypothetical protein
LLVTVQHCLLKQVIEEKIDRRTGVTGRCGRSKQLLDDLEKKEDTGNWKRKH